MPKIRYIGFALLFCVIMFAGFRIYKMWKTRHEIQRSLSSKAYLDKIEACQKDKIDSTSIVFIGNSLVDDFNLALFNNPKLVNQGISGDFTIGLIARIDPILKKHPAKIFIEIGINDLIEQVPQQTMLANYDTIVRKINTLSPRTAVYVHSLLPTRKGSIFTPMRKINERVMQFNVKLQGLAKKYQATYIDTWSHYAMPDNSMNPKLTWDGIHLTKEGYQIWANVIRDFVN